MRDFWERWEGERGEDSHEASKQAFGAASAHWPDLPQESKKAYNRSALVQRSIRLREIQDCLIGHLGSYLPKPKLGSRWRMDSTYIGQTRAPIVVSLSDFEIWRDI